MIEVLEERGSVLFANDARADDVFFCLLSSKDGMMVHFCRPSPTTAVAAVASRRRMEVEGQQVAKADFFTFCVVVVAIVSSAY